MTNIFQFFLRLVICFSTSAISLWIVDILVNYQIIGKMFSYTKPMGRIVDYAGLFLADAQFAFLLSLTSLFGAWIFTKIFKKTDYWSEVLFLLSTGVCTLTFLGCLIFVHEFHDISIKLTILIASILGFVYWICFRIYLKKQSNYSWSFLNILQYSIYPALIMGFANASITKLILGKKAGTVSGSYLVAGIYLIIAATLTIIGLNLLKTESSKRKSLFRMIPIFLTLTLIIITCFYSYNYGTNPDVNTNKASSDKPNIILIVLDTVRADHLKLYGYWRNTMPALEKWAENSLIASRAVSPAGWTAPAHASFFSGHTVSLHGIHTNMDNNSLKTRAIKDIQWLPGLLSKEGYYSLAVAANPVAIPDKRNMGFDRVFVPYHEYEYTLGSLIDRYSPLLMHTSERLRWRMPYIDAKGIVKITKKAVPKGNGPLFLFVNFFDAHYPYNPPSSAFKEIGGEKSSSFSRYMNCWDMMNKWDSLPSDKFEYLNNLYDGEMRWLDKQLSGLLSWIDQRFGENTITIITSDHGEDLGENGIVGHYYGLSQHLIHVPLFIRGPGIEAKLIDDVVTTRKLFDFIMQSGKGQRPSPEILIKKDAFGILSERYPSGSHVLPIGFV